MQQNSQIFFSKVYLLGDPSNQPQFRLFEGAVLKIHDGSNTNLTIREGTLRNNGEIWLWDNIEIEYNGTAQDVALYNAGTISIAADATSDPQINISGLSKAVQLRGTGTVPGLAAWAGNPTFVQVENDRPYPLTVGQPISGVAAGPALTCNGTMQMAVFPDLASLGPGSAGHR